MTPSCPPHWTCAFEPKNPPHPPYWAHWWDGPWGIVVGILAVGALTAVLITLGYYLAEYRKERLGYLEREKARRHEEAIEEQRTMQLDAAKGNPEMLKMVGDMARRVTYR